MAVRSVIPATGEGRAKCLYAHLTLTVAMADDYGHKPTLHQADPLA